MRRFTLRLSKDEYRSFKVHAQRQGKKKMGQFIKDTALAYLEQEYVPRDSKPIADLASAIRKIGNNVNQIVHGIHRTLKRQQFTGAFDDRKAYEQLLQNYTVLVKDVEEIRASIQQYLTSPPLRLGDALWELLQDQPDKIHQLRAMLDEIEAQQNNAND